MLEIRNLTKRYKNNKGIFDINYSFEEGKVYALVGPNGSGKTTLIQMIAGISDPLSGTVELAGNSTMARSCKKEIGYALKFTNDYTKQTIYQFLTMVCEIKYKGKYTDEIDRYLKDFELTGDGNTRIADCSLGKKKKVGIITSFIGLPTLIILDEPTNGLDTTGLIQLKRYIEKAKESRHIVIVSSHVLDFVDAIMDKVIFLKEGRIASCDGSSTEEQYRRLYIGNSD